MIDPNDYEKLAEPVLKRQEELYLYIIDKLARRIKKIGTILPSDLFQIENLINIGEDINDINTKLAEMVSMNIRQIDNIIDTVAKDMYKDSKEYFEYRKLVYQGYKENDSIQNAVKAIKKVTTEACYGANPYTSPYMNISGSHAIGMLVKDNTSDKLVLKDLADAYKSVVDYGIQSVSFGVRDYQSVMRETMTKFTDSGLRRVVWESGYTQRLDTSVRRNLLDGISKVAIAVQDIVGQQFGSDGKELTVHYNSAPDHEPFQGHQLTNAQWENLQTHLPFTDVKGNQFPAQVRAIGEMNCRHFAYSIIVGVSKPVHSDEELQEYITKNNKGYTDKQGNHLTMYECTQKQRKMELAIRKLQEQRREAKVRGDKVKENAMTDKIKKSVGEYLSFTKSCGLKPRQDRLGY